MRRRVIRRRRPFRRARRPIRRRRLRGRRRPRRAGVQHYRFMYPDHITITKNTSAGLAVQFMLSQFVKNPACDYYRLNAAVVKVIPQQTSAFPGTGGDNTRIWTCVDYDDNVTPKNRLEFQNQQGVRVHRGDRGFTCKLRPKPMLLTQATDQNPAATFMTGRRRGHWLNSANANVSHHGLKVWFEGPVNGPITYNILVKTYWSFMKPIVPPPVKPNQTGCLQMLTMQSYQNSQDQASNVKSPSSNCNVLFHAHTQGKDGE